MAATFTAPHTLGPLIATDLPPAPTTPATSVTWRVPLAKEGAPSASAAPAGQRPAERGGGAG